MAANSRQARLRPQYASWYPNISATTWYPVMTLVRQLTRQPVHGELDPRSSPRWIPGGRPLEDSHFEFRGGVQRDSSWRTRAGDTTVWPAAPDRQDVAREGPAREEKHRS